MKPLESEWRSTPDLAMDNSTSDNSVRAQLNKRIKCGEPIEKAVMWGKAFGLPWFGVHYRAKPQTKKEKRNSPEGKKKAHEYYKKYISDPVVAERLRKYSKDRWHTAEGKAKMKESMRKYLEKRKNS